MNILIYIVAILGGIVGVLSTLYCVVSLPIVIIGKFYRKVRFGISMFK